MKIALVQVESVCGEPDANIETIRRSMDETDADLLVFPEMFLTGYNLGDEVFKKALDLGGKRIAGLSALCREKGKALIFGMPRRDDVVRGEVYNSAVAMDANGGVSVYDKWYLPNFGPFDERRYFRPGGHLSTLEVNGMTFGLIICYDLFFPEFVKLYAMMGCDAVVCISASPCMTAKFFKKLLPARAIENTAYMVYSNVLGDQRNVVFWGGAQVWSPLGNAKAKAKEYEEEIVECVLDPEEIECSRHLRPTIKDTKRDLLPLTDL